ncbi:FAD-binding protein [Desulfobacterota bacterium AH_259_B03_O07]|nr:FAD-binding protein [Desulfobacterota bacterium AH_259_B03_O07]
MNTKPEIESTEWKNKFCGKLVQILSEEGVISSQDELIAYECDALTAYSIKPIFVVLPRSTKQVSEVIKLCNKENIPFVPRGAGTGLSGGALPTEEGIVITLARMNHILEIDIPNQRVVVEPGVVNLWVSDAINRNDYYYAPDPSSQSVCTIGGNVAENSGGVHCIKYGVTTNHILSLEVVLPDGEIVEFGGKTLDHPGYDLVGLFVGSEGLLGIVTKVTLRIIRKPEEIKTFLASFDRIEDAGASVSGITAKGIIPAGMEIMDYLCIQSVNKAVQAGYPENAKAILLVELDGPIDEIEAQMPLVMEVFNENRAKEIRIAKDTEERDLFWKGRKSAFAAMGRVSPDYYVQDGVIPRSKLAEVLGEIKNLSKKYGLRVANVFHAGDGNLHPLILYDSSKEEEAEKTEELAVDILKVCVDVGGSITGEHGVGYDKKKFISLMFDEKDLDTMNLIRCTFDPQGLCNPGKLFPTPRTCVEQGRKSYRVHPVEKAGLGEMY